MQTGDREEAGTYFDGEISSVHIVAEKEVSGRAWVSTNLDEFHQVILDTPQTLSDPRREEVERILTYCPCISPTTAYDHPNQTQEGLSSAKED